MRGAGGDEGHGAPDERGWWRRWRPRRDEMRWPRNTPPTVEPHGSPPEVASHGLVGHQVVERPAQIEAHWRRAMPRGEAAMARAAALAPTLVGMTVQQAEQEVAHDPDLLLRVLPEGAVVTAEAVFGRINVLVIDGRVTGAYPG